jgi:hypothetical protein
VIIGKNYNENVLSVYDEVSVSPSPVISSKASSKLSKKPTVSVTSKVTEAIKQLGKTNKSSGVIQIVFPKEHAIVPGNHPLIKGKAIPHTDVTLTLRNKKLQTIYTTKLQTDTLGEWKLSLPIPLSPGEYTLTMTTVDGNSSPVKTTRTFTTAKSGEEVVLGTATGEATITPAPTTIAELPTATPVISEVLPTNSYATLTPVITKSIVTTTPPVTGENNSYIVLGSAVLVIIGAGVLLLL